MAVNRSPEESIELVRKAQHGDDEALNRLFERYYSRVRRIVRMRLGRRLAAHTETEDILQETFAAAVEAFDRFEMRDDASLINWLARLAERKIIAAADFFGAKKRDRRREIRLPAATHNDSSVASAEIADSLDGPLQKAEDAELRALVDDCVAELSDDYRELILLRDYAGSSWEQVARETGRPSAEAARMMHTRAMLELTRRMREKGVQ